MYFLKFEAGFGEIIIYEQEIILTQSINNHSLDENVI